LTSIIFEDVNKTYPNGKKAISNLNLEINEGHTTTLIGPSGCGKTTLLKMINGLIPATKGYIYIEGKLLSDWDIIDLRRQIGYVIQQVGLFPHLNIEKNISYVLKIMGVDKKKQRERAEELIELVGLELNSLNKYPRELSGGQQQRVGVARALAADPRIILMDEPFGAIDEITRKTLQNELLNLQEKLKKTIVFVTHDIEEAMKLGDKIVLLKDGRLEQKDNPKEIFFNPKTDFVKEFFGIKNFSSFMNITSIKEAIDREYPNVLEQYTDNFNSEGKTYVIVDKEGKYLGIYGEDVKALKTSQSIMQGIYELFDRGKGILPVVDEKNIYQGMFSIDNINKNIKMK
jgi:osmoprotectant transport system ATP-binding protein